jgi:hypothetical protein
MKMQHICLAIEGCLETVGQQAAFFSNTP